MTFTIKSDDVTILQFTSLRYSNILNNNGEFEVIISGVPQNLRTHISSGKKVKIYRDGVIDFEGEIQETENLMGGISILRGVGSENVFSETDPPVDSGTHKKVYTSSTDNTIFSDILGSVSGWTADVSSSTATNISAFRTSDSMGCWKAIMSLINLTGKDIFIDYINHKLYLKDSQGGANAFTFVESETIADVTFKDKIKQASKVIIYGKGDGENQIIGEAGSGTPVKKITDRNIINTTEANNRATKELALITNSTKNYNFSVIKPNMDISLGDRGTMTSYSVGLSSEPVDIVKISRGITNEGNEILDLEVANHEYRKSEQRLNSQISKNQYDSMLTDSSMSGATNVWGDTGTFNASPTVPYEMWLYVPPNVVDEAGNTNINSVKLTYICSDYLTYAQTVSGAVATNFTGVSITNQSKNANPTITNIEQGASDTGYQTTNTSETSLTGDNTWQTVTTSVVLGNYDWMFHAIFGVFHIDLSNSSGSDSYDGQTIYVRARFVTGTTSYFPDSNGMYISVGHSISSSSHTHTIGSHNHLTRSHRHEITVDSSGDDHGGDTGYAGSDTTYNTTPSATSTTVGTKYTKTIPFMLYVPYNYTNTTVTLQYKIQDETDWDTGGSGIQYLIYSYWGSRGHTHSNTVADGSAHTHVNSLGDPEHDHSLTVSGGGYELSSQSTSASSVDIRLYNSSGTLLNTWSSQPTNQNNLDMSDYITATGRYRVTITPDANTMVYGVTVIKAPTDS